MARQLPKGFRAVDGAQKTRALPKGFAPVDATPTAPVEPSEAEALARGAGQGVTLGFADEARAAVEALAEKVPWANPLRVLAQATSGRPLAEMEGSKQDLLQLYRKARAGHRADEAQAQQAHPGLYAGGMVAGSLPIAALAPGYGGAALTGAASGLGGSEADVTRGHVGGAAIDTGVGALAGVGGQALGNAVAKPLGKLAGVAGRRVGAATQKIRELAKGKLDEAIASARGALGGEVQKGNRFVENIMRLAETGTPAQKAALAEMEASGALQKLREQLLGSNLADLPGQEALIGERRSALQALVKDAPKKLAQLEGEIASPWSQIKPRLQRYAAPLLGTALGAPVGAGVGFALGGGEGGRMGAAVGGLAGAGARPAARALTRMAQHPALQRPLWQAIGAGASGAAASLPPSVRSVLSAAQRDPQLRAEMARALALAEALRRREEEKR